MVIGEAAALGLAVNIPIIIRSLADSLSSLTSIPQPGRTLKFHESMLTALDNGLSADDPCALVPDYACAWWNDETAPDADHIMSSNNVAKLLAVHGTNRAISDLRVQTQAPPRPRPACTQCTKCREYRDLAADAIAELQGVLQYARAMEVSAGAICEADTRRAQGFFLLHEGVQRKEMVEVGTATVSSAKPQLKGPTKIDGVKVNPKSRRVLATAAAELARLQQLPTGSYKWTWGPRLTDAEAIGLLAPPGEPVPPHSGYDISLTSGGCMRFPESPLPSMPGDGSIRVSSLSSDHQIPLLTNSIPTIGPLASTSRLGEVQGSNHRAVLGMEQEGGGLHTVARTTNAEADHASGDSSDDSPVNLAAVWGPRPSATTPQDTPSHCGGDADTNIAVGDLAPVGGIVDEAEAVSARAAEADSDDSVGDLAQIWGKLDDAQAQPRAEAVFDSDDSGVDLVQTWGRRGNAEEQPANDAESDSDDSVGDLGALWGRLDDADEGPVNPILADSEDSDVDLGPLWRRPDDADTQPPIEAEPDSDDSVGDLATLWGNRDDAKDQAASASDGHSDDSIGDLGQLWGRVGDAASESPGIAGASRSGEAGPGAGSTSTHEPSVPDQTTAISMVSPSKVTLTARGPFTALDFEYLDPSWLDPPAEAPLLDSDEEEYSDDGTNQSDISEEYGSGEVCGDGDESDADDDAEAA